MKQLSPVVQAKPKLHNRGVSLHNRGVSLHNRGVFIAQPGSFRPGKPLFQAILLPAESRARGIPNPKGGGEAVRRLPLALRRRPPPALRIMQHRDCILPVIVLLNR